MRPKPLRLQGCDTSPGPHGLRAIWWALLFLFYALFKEMVRTFRDRNAFPPPVSPPFPPRPCPPASQARPGPSPASGSTETSLTASWGWCPTLARREWQWAPPCRSPRFSALCNHWYSELPAAGPADGLKEPAASSRRGPAPDPGPGPGPPWTRSPRPPWVSLESKPEIPVALGEEH